MRVFPISYPLSGEHLAATSPVMQPESEGAGWRLRLNFWAGRALTADALELEQDNRSGRLAWRGRLFTAGIVTGLDVALESPAKVPQPLAPGGHFIHVMPGYGLLANGEDVVIPRPLRVSLDQIPVHYVRVDGANAEKDPPEGASAGKLVSTGGLAFRIDDFKAGYLPWAAVLVLRPAEILTARNNDPADPCALDLSRDPFIDERRLDASQLCLCQLPQSMLTLLVDPDNATWRNRLAHTVLSQEAAAAARQQVRFFDTLDNGSPSPADRKWGIRWRSGGLLPWELLGMPLALLSSEMAADIPDDPDKNVRHFFVDRAAVTRPGGFSHSRSRPAIAVATRTTDHPGAGTPFNWRARVDQFAEHMGAFPIETETDVRAVASRFQFVPPAGFLPRRAMDFLTASQALVLPARPNQPPDRAGISHFFPASFAVEAVPVPIENLDAALAAGAALTPYDLNSSSPETVRVLVPLPERVFDPQLLVVEQEDPIFSAMLGRFVATRQDWRQRRDFVRRQRDALQEMDAGLPPVSLIPLLEPGQLEREPVEAANKLGFSAALLSPAATPGPWEAHIKFAVAHKVMPTTTLFLRLRLDLDFMPGPINVRWRGENEDFHFVWSEPPAAPLERIDDKGESAFTPLWLRFTVTAELLGMRSGNLSGLTLHLDYGRLAVASAGALLEGEQPGETEEDVWWQALDESPPPEFTGAAWIPVDNKSLMPPFDKSLLAPFEDSYVPVFPDNRSLDNRLAEVELALNPDKTAVTPTPRLKALSVTKDGLDRALTELEAEANEADDFVDMNFARAQVNLYRIRKLILGESAAQKLLINPAIAAIADEETATASAEKLGSFLKEAKTRAVTGDGLTKLNAELTKELTHPVPVPAAPPPLAGPLPQGLGPERSSIRVPLAVADQRMRKSPTNLEGSNPETGPVLLSRGLSIGQRFVEPSASKNLSYARSALNDLLNQMQALRLPLSGETVRSAGGQDVKLLELQGRAVLPATDPITLRNAAMAKLFEVAPATDTDEAEVTLAALDFTEIKSAILRTIERVIQQRRLLIQTGIETLSLVRAQRDSAAGRVLVIDGKLAEARHDVSVARALRLEERQRVSAVNEGRDALIRNEIKFLAYVRPRTVDLARRSLPHWKLEGADVPAPLPSCLRRHDESPQPLTVYVNLFRDAPARWFPALEVLLIRLDTADKLIALLNSARSGAASFAGRDGVAAIRNSVEAVQFTVLGAHQMVAALRQKSTAIQIGGKETRRWTDLLRDAGEVAAVGDLIQGEHGSHEVSVAAAQELEQIGHVATCLHAEFAAVPPAIRLAWVERFSQFDQPSLLRDLSRLPHYGQLDRPTRRVLQEFADWLFGRVKSTEPDAVNLINDLIRLCLLLASHAPVNRIISGHVPRPTPVRPGTQIPITPLNPDLVRVGMEFHVWQSSRVVAKGRVEDLQQGEVSARVDYVAQQITTLDATMQVQFVAPALGISKQLGLL